MPHFALYLIRLVVYLIRLTALMLVVEVLVRGHMLGVEVLTVEGVQNNYEVAVEVVGLVLFPD